LQANVKDKDLTPKRPLNALKKQLTGTKTKRMDNLIYGDNSAFFKTGGDLENEEKYR